MKTARWMPGEGQDAVAEPIRRRRRGRKGKRNGYPQPTRGLGSVVSSSGGAENNCSGF